MLRNDMFRHVVRNVTFRLADDHEVIKRHVGRRRPTGRRRGPDLRRARVHPGVGEIDARERQAVKIVRRQMEETKVRIRQIRVGG